MSKLCGIYKITSPSNRIYIGQSINIDSRFNYYRKYSNKCKTQPKLLNSFEKYKPQNHIFEIIEECSIELLNKKERYWQDYYDSINLGLNCIYTNTDTKSGKLSEETKLKISNNRKNKGFGKRNERTLEEKEKTIILLRQNPNWDDRIKKLIKSSCKEAYFINYNNELTFYKQLSDHPTKFRNRKDLNKNGYCFTRIGIIISKNTFLKQNQDYWYNLLLNKSINKCNYKKIEVFDIWFDSYIIYEKIEDFAKELNTTTAYISRILKENKIYKKRYKISYINKLLCN